MCSTIQAQTFCYHGDILGSIPLQHWNQLGRNWKEILAWEQNFFTAVGVFPVELLAYQVSMVCIVDLILGWVFDVINHLIGIFYRNFEFKYLRK